DLHHVFISHYHYDHASDLGTFLFSRMINTQIGRAGKDLNIYGPADDDVKKQVAKVRHNTFHPYGKDSTFRIGAVAFNIHRNAHSVETYVMRITDGSGSVLVYMADTSYRKSLVEFSEGADVLITECSLHAGEDGEPMGHMNAEDVGMPAEK